MAAFAFVFGLILGMGITSLRHRIQAPWYWLDRRDSLEGVLPKSPLIVPMPKVREPRGRTGIHGGWIPYSDGLGHGKPPTVGSGAMPPKPRPNN